MPLEHHYLVGRRLHPMHVEQDGVLLPNPYVVSLDQQELRVKDLPPAGQRRDPDAADRPPARRAPPRLRAAPRGGRRGPGAGRACCPRSTSSSAGPAATGASVAAGVGRRARPRAPRPTASASAPRARAAWIDEEDLVTLGFYEFLDGLDGRRRRAPRRHAPGVQGDRRGAVRGRAREGGVRHRDAVARHQHAGEDGRDRGPVEVPGRAARDPHARASTRS